MPTSYRFTGQREDTTGLYFYNARYYDPVVGRFAQADTILPNAGNPQDLNRYSYARNSPVCYNDPSGHVAWWVTAGIGLAFDVAADAVIAKVTGEKFDLASSVATNVVMNVATAGLGGKLTKMGKLTKVVQQGLKHGDDAAEVAAKVGGEIVEEATERIGKEATEKATQIHHLLTNKSSQWTRPMQQIASKYGLDLGGDWNKVAMPHSGRHANAYHEWALTTLQRIDEQADGNVDDFLRLFDEQIKNTVVNSPDMVGKDWWK